MSSPTSTRFEWLSNEIVLDIFVYLDAYHMYQAWYGLNARINALLHSVPLHIRYDGSMANRILWDAVESSCQSSQIRILSCFGDMKIDRRILTHPMENLRTIVLYNIVLPSIDEVCRYIRPNNQIKCLSIQSKPGGWYSGQNQSFQPGVLVEHYHRFQSLTHLSLVYHWYEDFPINFPVLSHLRYLSLGNSKFSHDLLRSVQTNMPSLRSLKFQGLYDSLIPASIIVKHVQELAITIREDLSGLVGVLSNFPSLCRLHIESSYRQRDGALNGYICQHLIEGYLSYLKQLTIDFNPAADEEVRSSFHKGKFWSKKRVKTTTWPALPNSRCPMVNTISFGEEWRFSYFDKFSLAQLLTC